MTNKKSKAKTMTVEEIANNLGAVGIPPEIGVDNSRLLIKALRALAEGNPVTETDLVRISQELELPFEHVEEFLGQFSEKDSSGNIIGSLGLSQNQRWPHRFFVNGNSLRTWCAWDSLFLPGLLNATAKIESESPVSGTTVHITVTPDGVESFEPETAVVSFAIIDPEVHDVSSIEAIWGNFCHQVHFFPTPDEANEWAYEKSDIAILSVEDAFEVGKLAFSKILAYA